MVSGIRTYPALNAANTAQFLVSLLLPFGNQATRVTPGQPPDSGAAKSAALGLTTYLASA